VGIDITDQPFRKVDIADKPVRKVVKHHYLCLVNFDTVTLLTHEL
jgi:hypothetical protein